jgi:FkbM family methyltransferase
MNGRKIARDVFLRSLGLERSYRPPALLRHPDWNFGELLRLVVGCALRTHPNFTFLQVGAFDGRTADPIHPLVEEFGIRGIVVEPQARMLETLTASYAAYPQVAVVNAAIANADGRREFYSTTDGRSRQASFFRSHLLDHGVPPDAIVAQAVSCLTISSLLRQHGLTQCDLIQIDAEGYDYEIVRSIDFDAIQPLIVRFEQAHMSNRDRDDCVALLTSRGFRFISERRDIIALREF